MSADLSFRSVAKDVATLGTGMLLATLFGTMQVFLIPRVVSLEDFGYWRLFVLYNSFAGLLHMGLADGALLRWGGKDLHSTQPEIRSSLEFLLWQQLAVLACLGLTAITALPTRLRGVGVGLLVFAGIFNVTTLLQYGLQAARKFKEVAVASALPMGVFVVLAALWALFSTPNVGVLIGLFVLGWSCALVFYWVRVRPFTQENFATEVGIGWQLLALGWPLVLSNTVYGLIQTIDRLAISSIFPIGEFAQYSFAASTLFVPIAAVSAGAQVFFPHIAATQEKKRVTAYSEGSLLLVAVWGLCLPYYFLLQIFVHYLLPKYEPCLPVAAVLMLGVPFLAGIQILQNSFFNIHRLQRDFLKNAIGALLLGAFLVLAAAFRFRSLAAIATAQVLTFVLWWLFNEWRLRSITRVSILEWTRRAGLFFWSAAILWAAMRVFGSAGLRLAMFYALLIVGFVSLCPQQTRFVSRLICNFKG